MGSFMAALRKANGYTQQQIADKLNVLGIPYRYECPVLLNGNVKVYPDFTILQMPERKEVYLEHFGMMDNPEYCKKAVERIQELARHVIVLGKNLFAIFETKDTPLDTTLVKKMLKEFM